MPIAAAIPTDLICVLIGVGTFVLLALIGTVKNKREAERQEAMAAATSRAANHYGLLPDEPFFFTKVVGVAAVRGRQEVVRSCGPGQWLKLVPEPDNPVDAAAVKVTTWDGRQLGYLDADMASRFQGGLLAGTRRYRVMITSITGGHGYKKRLGCNIRISWYPGEVYPPGTPGVWPPMPAPVAAPDPVPAPAAEPAPAPATARPAPQPEVSLDFPLPEAPSPRQRSLGWAILMTALALVGLLAMTAMFAALIGII